MEKPMALNILCLNCDIWTGVSLFQGDEHRLQMLDGYLKLLKEYFT